MKEAGDRYFAKGYPEDAGALYRITGLEGAFYMDSRWQNNSDIYRRYLNGFDPDVQEIGEEEARRVMAKIDHHCRSRKVFDTVKVLPTKIRFLSDSVSSATGIELCQNSIDSRIYNGTAKPGSVFG